MRTTYNASKIKGIEGYKKLTYADKGISFEVPSNWGLNRLFVQGNLIAIGPMQTRISIHLSIMSEYWDKVDSNLERYRSEKSGFKLLSDQATEIQGCSAREITYLFIDSEKGLAKKEVELIISHKKAPVVLTYESTESDFSKYLEAYDRLKSSFRFTLD